MDALRGPAFAEALAHAGFLPGAPARGPGSSARGARPGGSRDS
jgi:hypothetical protein